MMWLYANLSDSSISCNLRAKSRTEQILITKSKCMQMQLELGLIVLPIVLNI